MGKEVAKKVDPLVLIISMRGQRDEFHWSTLLLPDVWILAVEKVRD